MNYDRKHETIYKSIEALDKMGMDIIETGEPDAFKQYLLETDNTICGRHPISVFLHVSVSTFFIYLVGLFKWALNKSISITNFIVK